MNGVRGETTILCEGYDDRAFWSGILVERFACVNIWQKALPGRDPGVDPAGDAVKGKGHFGFVTPSERFLRIIPTHGPDEGTRTGGAEKLLADLPAAIDRARQRDPRPERIVISVDGDAEAKALGALRRITSEIQLELAVWKFVGEEPHDEHGSLCPAQQTVERLICAALASAHPDRARWLVNALDARPRPLGTHQHKVHAHTWFAGFFTDHGSDFFRDVWRDDETAFALGLVLDGTGLLDKIRSWVE